MVRIAQKVLRKSDYKAHKHGALVLRGGSIVSIGYNSHNGTIHAEVQALKKLWPSKRRGCTIVSVREGKNGRLGMAKPCEDCSIFLLANGVKTVLYSDSDGKMVRMRL